MRQVLYCCCYFFFSIPLLHSQNLIINPSAESVPTANGWTQTGTTPTNCYGGSGWRMQGNQNDFPVAQSGSYFFAPGCGGNGAGAVYELYQNVNVTSNATAIDAGAYLVTFSGYMRSYNQLPPDQTAMIVEYRNAANNTVLQSYNTGTVTNTSSWVNYSNTRVAPVGTRYIRIRLIGTSRNGSSVDTYFDNLSLSGVVDYTLPVRFLDFSATAEEKQVVLSWKTSDEINNAGFHVERSSDGSSWEDLAFVPASSAYKSIYTYRYADKAPLVGNSYYRLRQVDIDEKYSYSTIIRVKSDDFASRCYIYPNPARDVVKVYGNVSNKDIRLFSGDGKFIKSYKNTSMLDVHFLQPGLYYLRIEGDESIVLKLLKQ